MVKKVSFRTIFQKWRYSARFLRLMETPFLSSHRHHFVYSDYLRPRFLRRIDKSDIRMIFELGSFDGHDSILLRDTFRAVVHAFECNPEALAICRESLKNEGGIFLVEKAAWNFSGKIPFYPVVEASEDGKPISNMGASSCYKALPGYRQKYKQARTEVDAVRIDEYCRAAGVERIDLVCMDVQGAALPALRGFGTLLEKVGYIVVELEKEEIYRGQSLFEEVDCFLKGRGFEAVEEICRDFWFSDYLYINSNLA